MRTAKKDESHADKEAPHEPPLDTIGRKYHARMRTVHAASDSLSEGVVVPALREAIVEGVLAPGSRLSEVQIAKQLNVSRTPMREAFAQLEREGLVTVLPRIGAFVRSVTERDVEEIYTVRSALECLAVQLAADRITALGRAQLDDVVQAMQASVDADDPASYVDALDRFYTVVMTIADNKTLQESHAALIGPVRRVRRIAMARGGRMRSSYEQSVRIRDAIVNHDACVQDLMRTQLQSACKAALDVLNHVG
ncbi:MAG TPA: GntR family transcriptional regulator [Paraburkholderia sp.]|nr:GntR family transcriptional regulator [Paraburkholderia sp.]